MAPNQEIEKRLPVGGEIARKAIHLLTLIIPVTMHIAGTRRSAAGLALLAFLAVAADVVRSRNVRIEHGIRRAFGWMMRNTELADGSGILINGATYLLIGALAATVLFGAADAANGLAVFVVADAASGLVGRWIGRRTWLRSNATIEGSLAYVIMAVAVGTALPGVTLTGAITMAMVTAPMEAAAPVNDNLFVPVVAAATLYLL